MRGSGAAAGAGLTLLAHAGAGSAKRAAGGPRALTSRRAAPGRAGQGRTGLDCERHPARLGLAEAGGPRWSLLSVPRRSQWRAVPSYAPGCLAPRVAAGAGGRARLGGLGSGLPNGGFPGKRRPGARSRPGRGRRGITTQARAARADFLGKLGRLRPFCEAIDNPTGWQTTPS